MKIIKPILLLFISLGCYQYSSAQKAKLQIGTFEEVPALDSNFYLKYKLISVDSLSLAHLHYYILLFRRGKKLYKVFTNTFTPGTGDCWEPLKAKNKYRLHLVELGGVYVGEKHKLILPIQRRGLGALSGVVLKEGEPFYQAKEINGMNFMRK